MIITIKLFVSCVSPVFDHIGGFNTVMHSLSSGSLIVTLKDRSPEVTDIAMCDGNKISTLRERLLTHSCYTCRNRDTCEVNALIESIGTDGLNSRIEPEGRQG